MFTLFKKKKITENVVTEEKINPISAKEARRILKEKSPEYVEKEAKQREKEYQKHLQDVKNWAEEKLKKGIKPINKLISEAALKGETNIEIAPWEIDHIHDYSIYGNPFSCGNWYEDRCLALGKRIIEFYKDAGFDVQFAFQNETFEENCISPQCSLKISWEKAGEEDE